VDRRQCGQEARWRFAGVRRVSARGLRCLPMLAGEDEEDEAELEVGPPEHERRHDNSRRLTLREL
jgi:hypothetical protein